MKSIMKGLNCNILERHFDPTLVFERNLKTNFRKEFNRWWDLENRIADMLQLEMENILVEVDNAIY